MEDEEIMILKDDHQREFTFNIELGGNALHFTIKENKIYAPFTYEASFTSEDMINHHKIFKSCDNDLEEIQERFRELYKGKRLMLIAYGHDSEIAINCRLDYLSKMNDQAKDFVLNRKMTEEKDRDLLELYRRQKEYNKKLDKIGDLIEKLVLKEDPLYKEINAILKKK